MRTSILPRFLRPALAWAAAGALALLMGGYPVGYAAPPPPAVNAAAAEAPSPPAASGSDAEEVDHPDNEERGLPVWPFSILTLSTGAIVVIILYVNRRASKNDPFRRR